MKMDDYVAIHNEFRSILLKHELSLYDGMKMLQCMHQALAWSGGVSYDDYCQSLEDLKPIYKKIRTNEQDIQK